MLNVGHGKGLLQLPLGGGSAAKFSILCWVHSFPHGTETPGYKSLTANFASRWCQKASTAGGGGGWKKPCGVLLVVSGVCFQAGCGNGEEKRKLCILSVVSEMATLKVCSSVTKISKMQLKS